MTDKEVTWCCYDFMWSLITIKCKNNTNKKKQGTNHKLNIWLYAGIRERHCGLVEIKTKPHCLSLPNLFATWIMLEN